MGPAPAISLMSAPAAKARSLPVTTMARIPSSRSSASSASHSASMVGPFSAFSCFGRLSRTSATRRASSRSTRTRDSAWARSPPRQARKHPQGMDSKTVGSCAAQAGQYSAYAEMPACPQSGQIRPAPACRARSSS